MVFERDEPALRPLPGPEMARGTRGREPLEARGMDSRSRVVADAREAKRAARLERAAEAPGATGKPRRVEDVGRGGRRSAEPGRADDWIRAAIRFVQKSDAAFVGSATARAAAE